MSTENIVYFLLYINNFIIFHTNNCKPTLPTPYIHISMLFVFTLLELKTEEEHILVAHPNFNKNNCIIKAFRDFKSKFSMQQYFNIQNTSP